MIPDNKLTFKDYTDYICKKVSKKLGGMKILGRLFIKQLFYFVPIFVEQFYILDEAALNRLQVLQNREMQLILGCGLYVSVKGNAS